MRVYKFTVTASFKSPSGGTRNDVSEHYIAAYSYEQAHDHVVKNLTRAGWEVVEITEKDINVFDIRDAADHTTD